MKTFFFPAVTQTPEEPAMVMPAATRTLPWTGMCGPVTPLAVGLPVPVPVHEGAAGAGELECKGLGAR